MSTNDLESRLRIAIKNSTDRDLSPATRSAWFDHVRYLHAQRTPATIRTMEARFK